MNFSLHRSNIFFFIILELQQKLYFLGSPYSRSLEKRAWKLEPMYGPYKSYSNVKKKKEGVYECVAELR